MKANEIIQCPNCRGKGHVIDACAALPVLGWILGVMERNDPRGASRHVPAWVMWGGLWVVLSAFAVAYFHALAKRNDRSLL